GDARQHHAPASRDDVRQGFARGDDGLSPEHAGPGGPRVGLVRPDAEHDRLDEAELAFGRLDAKALAATQPVEARAQQLLKGRFFPSGLHVAPYIAPVLTAGWRLLRLREMR